MNSPQLSRKPLQRLIVNTLVAGSIFIATTVSAQTPRPIPAPFLRPVVQQINNETPRGLIVRLPGSMPSMSGFVPEVFASGDYLAVRFIIPGCPLASCESGRVFVHKRNAESRRRLEEIKQYGDTFFLRKDVRAFYSPGIRTARGYIPSVMWEQDGMIYGVLLAAGDEKPSNALRQELIDMAVSMANQPPLR